MIRDLKVLLVGDERELRDSARLRRLRRQTTGANLVAAVLGGLAAAACAALAARAVWAAAFLARGSRGELLLAALVFLVFAAGAAAFAAAFARELSLDPLWGYFGRPEGYEFLAAEVVGASWRPAEGGRGGDYLLEVRYEGGRCLASVRASAWSAAFTTRGAEASLRPGDDWSDLKGKRRVLPVRGWVLRRLGGRSACLAGVSRV